tara:strand:+ start:1499 stop:2443 length:945 start_codon:yes stop_codon:yes gene_type:complete
MAKKIALVFGASGQDGTFMCKLLKDKNYNVIAITRRSNFENHKKINLKVKKKKVDIYNISKVEKIIKTSYCNEIYYFAGQSKFQNSFINILSTFKSHNLPLYNILFSVNKLKRKIKIFNSCSGLIYDPKEKVINENSNLNPNTPYGFSKLISYFLIKYFRENHKIWCMSGIFFNHDSVLRPKDHVIPKIVDFVKKNKFKTRKLLLGDINLKRDWGWAPEYIKFAYLLMQKKNPKDLIIATGKSFMLKEIIDKIFKTKKLFWKKHVRISKNIIKNNKINYMSSTVEIKNLKKYLGIAPNKDINDVFQLMIKSKIF